MKVTVRVDDRLCIGAGACYKEMPQVYEDQGDGTSRVREDIGGENAVLEGDLAKQAMDLVEECPVEALIVEVIEK